LRGDDARRQPDPRESARGDPERPPVPPQGQGHAGVAPAAGGRSLYPDGRRNAPEPDKTSARTAGRIRADLVEGELAAIERFLQPHERLLRFLRRKIEAFP